MPAHLILAGTSHHLAPVALRERLVGGTASELEIDAAARRIDGGGTGGQSSAGRLETVIRDQLGPAVVLATCNRLEVYCWAWGRPSVTAARLVRLLAAQAGLPPAALRPHLYAHADAAAVRHLIRVAAGLDSLALGESQIAGQVRSAWRTAATRAPLGAELDLVGRRALEAARHIRASGAFARHPSVATIAVAAADHALGGLSGRTAAVLGAGVTGKAAARALAAAGASHVVLLNRSPAHAAAVAETLNLGERLSSAPLTVLPDVLRDTDVVICATASALPVVPATVVQAATAARSARSGQPLVLVDIALPRDVDPAVRNVPGARLIDLDDLEAQCPLDAAGRRRELDRAEALAGEAADACVAALRAREAVPEIVALRRHAEAIRTSALRGVAGRLERLAPAERAAVEQLTRTIVQRLLHGPTVTLRRTAGASSAAARERAALLAALRQPGSRPHHARYEVGGVGAGSGRLAADHAREEG